jgi:hypothetical protein
LPRTAAKLCRLPSSWATEINLQSRYPGGIFVTKIGAAESSACRDAGAVNAIIPWFLLQEDYAPQSCPISESAESRNGRIF